MSAESIGAQERTAVDLEAIREHAEQCEALFRKHYRPAWDDVRRMASVDIPALLAEFDRLRAAAREWRPIKSAPNDGEHIIVGWADQPDWDPVIAYFVARWREVQGGEEFHLEPTHWQPVPAPPIHGGTE